MYGCIECGEINVKFTDGDEYSTRLCTCGKGGRVLDVQEAFDYIQQLHSELRDALVEGQELDILSWEDVKELHFENDTFSEELNDWELDD